MWNASRANGMRGMAQRISTTPRQQLKTQQYTQSQRHFAGPVIYAAAAALYTSELYYYILQEIPVSSPARPIQPSFNGQDKMPGHDGVTANCKLFFLFFLPTNNDLQCFFARMLASYSSKCSILCAVIIKLENF